MKIVRPVPITDANLSSSNVAENDYPAWSNTTAYSLGERAIRTATHEIYESLVAGSGTNTGHTPETSPDQWLDVGATNKWKMFDEARGSLTTTTNQIQVVLTPGAVDCLALLDVIGDHATVTMVVGGVTIYTRTIKTAIGGTSIDNWFSYFFEPIGTRTALIFDDLPLYAGGTITVTIAGATSSAPVACGTLLTGRMFTIGTTLTEPSIGITDFSKKVTDDYGVTTIVERPFADKTSLRVAIDSARTDAIKAALAAVRAIPTLYLADNDFASLVTYGWFNSFSIDLQGKTGTSFASLEIAGLI